MYRRVVYLCVLRMYQARYAAGGYYRYALRYDAGR